MPFVPAETILPTFPDVLHAVCWEIEALDCGCHALYKHFGALPVGPTNISFASKVLKPTDSENTGRVESLPTSMLAKFLPASMVRRTESAESMNHLLRVAATILALNFCLHMSLLEPWNPKAANTRSTSTALVQRPLTANVTRSFSTKANIASNQFPESFWAKPLNQSMKAIQSKSGRWQG